MIARACLASQLPPQAFVEDVDVPVVADAILSQLAEQAKEEFAQDLLRKLKER